jgi:hypothetical protein
MSHYPHRLNTRQRIRDKIATNYKGWNSIPMGTIATTMPKTLQCSVSYVGHSLLFSGGYLRLNIF